MSSRRILGYGLWLVVILALAGLAALALNTYRNPEPVTVEIDQEGVRGRFSVSRTRTLFNGDCLMLAWGIDNAGEILLNEAPVLPAGERAHCDGTPPQLRIATLDEGEIAYDVPQWALFDQWYAVLLLFLSGIGAVVGAMLLEIHQARLLQRSIIQYGLVFVCAVGWVVALDQFTNSLNIYRYVWDHYHYIDMAQNGVIDNPELVGPYAYRPIVPLLASFVGRFIERSVLAGFRIVTYVGLISQLVLVFALARQFTRKWWVAWTVLIVIGISTYNVKFLLFDIYRPDSLAFTLILIGMLAFIQRQRMVGVHTPPPIEGVSVGARHALPLQPTQRFWLNPLIYDAVILLTSAFGLLVREFCAIPAGLLVFRLLLEFYRTRRPHPLIKALLIVGIVGLVYWLPSKLIIVGRTDQLLNSDLSNLWNIVSNVTRNFNILLGTAIYLLPLLALLTPERARRLWRRLGGYRIDVTLYMLMVLVLALLGGSDIDRFVVYLFAPLIIVLALLLDDGLHPLEIGYALLATALYNRILAPIPQQNLEAYLDFYIVWHDRTSPIMWLRALELGLWIAGAVALRMGLAENQTAAIAKGAEKKGT